MCGTSFKSTVRICDGTASVVVLQVRVSKVFRSQATFPTNEDGLDECQNGTQQKQCVLNGVHAANGV